jgi:protein SCO1/2
MKNKSYIGISLVILVFGIIFVPKIVSRCQNQDVVRGERLDNISGGGEKETSLATIGKAPAFELTDQNGKKISNKDYLGKVYVLEFFFTTCPTICPKMNANMIQIQNAFFGNPNFGIASISINPEYDTPKVLKEHATMLGATSSNWHFLTGDKQYIYDLANKGFKVYAGESTTEAGGFEHQGFFALIDKEGNIRSRTDANDNKIVYYDGIEKAGAEMIMKDIKILLNE